MHGHICVYGVEATALEGCAGTYISTSVVSRSDNTGLGIRHPNESTVVRCHASRSESGKACPQATEPNIGLRELPRSKGTRGASAVPDPGLTAICTGHKRKLV
uniref:Uncharacterized protein n=1 Tax=Coccidioides posadasii RMSCC 3488 TaxID=454284 RepID=A0A0J6FR85_COCPO|nr:hypothetical protein CPAG_07841 [Coccidioides posadasii RMSCC 3488]